MIKALSHTSLYVLDQERARDFYVGKLGFEVGMDAEFDGFRWLTVGPAGQPDLQIVLMPCVAGGMMDEEAASHMRALLERDMIGGGVFETDDCQRDFEVLSANGVEFPMPPQARPWGTEAVFKDGCGHWFSLTQR